MIDTIEYEGQSYPSLQTIGNAAAYAQPFFDKICKGNNGCDVGCKRLDWSFNKEAILVDPEINTDYHALNLPPGKFDWIASSHMIEHITGRWQDVIEYWLMRLADAGIIFLYLPN